MTIIKYTHLWRWRSRTLSGMRGRRTLGVPILPQFYKLMEGIVLATSVVASSFTCIQMYGFNATVNELKYINGRSLKMNNFNRATLIFFFFENGYLFGF